ncbi:MAG: TlpA family protein disulfide reductase [Bacteroidetes bacterium]|nr:TlpA family protein disulfide reductase [Bacteroidota bacterium]
MNFLSKILIVLFFIGIQALYAQKTFQVTIIVPHAFDQKKWSCTYDDGREINTVKDNFVNNQLRIEANYFSKFAVLRLGYSESDSVSYGDSYFMDEKKARIVLKPISEKELGDPFKRPQLTNAISFNQSEFKQRLDAFNHKEVKAINDFWLWNASAIFKVDSLKNLFYEKLKALNDKNLVFIKEHPKDYFSFWYFESQIVPNTFIYAKSGALESQKLLSVFYSIFPNEYKNSFEGKKIEKFLVGKIESQTGMVAPNFKSRDMEGKPIALNDFKGKYVLLDFWATWCGPCMKDIPSVKKIRDEYPKDFLEIISISNDKPTDRIKVENTIRDHSMNWTQIFGDKDASKIFGVEEIPTMILINRKGVIVYRGNHADDKKLLELLKTNSPL